MSVAILFTCVSQFEVIASSEEHCLLQFKTIGNEIDSKILTS